MSSKPLEGRVALVTGSSRGVGRGIAESLGAAGATVYVTGRTANSADAPVMFGERIGGSVGDVAQVVTDNGGLGIAVVVDHSDDEQNRALIERIIAEQGKLDLLVNNAMVVPEEMQSGKPFWELPLDVWDRLIDVGLRGMYSMAYYAAPHMAKAGSGLIINTSGPGAKYFFYTPAYGVGKVGADRLAHDFAHELRPFGVAAVSVWSGLIRTELLQATVKKVDGYDLSITESPQFVGRAVAALAADPDIMKRSGETLYTSEIGLEYGLTDLDGKAPRSRRFRFGATSQFFVEKK